MGRSSLRHSREIQGIDSAGQTPEEFNETYNNLVPGAGNPNGPAAVQFFGEVDDIVAATGEEINMDFSVFFSGSDRPFTYSIAPALPASLSLDTNSGVLSGSGDAIGGPTSYTVTAQDQSTDTADTNSFTIEIV